MESMVKYITKKLYTLYVQVVQGRIENSNMLALVYIVTRLISILILIVSFEIKPIFD